MRPPIYVRPLSEAERQQVEAGLHSAQAFTLRRSQIVLASARGEPVLQIARALGCFNNALEHLAANWGSSTRNRGQAIRNPGGWVRCLGGRPRRLGATQAGSGTR